MTVSTIGSSVALAAVLGKGDDGKGGGKIDSIPPVAVQASVSVADGKVDGVGGLLDVTA